MKVAVLTDIHDNYENLRNVLEKIKAESVQAIIFLGDFCSPTTFRTLAETRLPFYFVFGNVDGEQFQITKEASKSNHINFDRDILEFELNNRKIAICHKPQFAEGLATTGKYDAVFHGHTHQPRTMKVNKTLLANPGEILGSVSGVSYGIYDTQTNEIKIEKLK